VAALLDFPKPLMRFLGADLSGYSHMTRYFDRLSTLHLLMLAVAGILFVQRLAHSVVGGRTRSFDDFIVLSLRHSDNLGVPVGPSWLQHAAIDITSLGGVTVLSIIAISVTLFLLIDGRGREALFFFAAVLSGWFLSNSLKLIVARPRPDLVPHLAVVNDPSFPSGHAMVSTVAYLLIAGLLFRSRIDRPLRVFIAILTTILLIAIGASRVFLGVHYPTDVLAGWFAGVAWVSLCWAIAPTFLAPVQR
jgi:undecaprenyl-diphosphatase